MTEAEVKKTNFIDSEMQARYYSNGGKFTVEDVEYAYDSGVKDGRKLGKEEQWKATEKAQKKTSARIRELEKENAELKGTVSRAGYRIAELKHECDELVERLNGIMSGDVAWQGDMDATIKQNLELKAQNKDLCESLDIMNNRESDLLEQIEKMKCCGNCSHRLDGTSFECKTTLWWQKCEKWELAE